MKKKIIILLSVVITLGLTSCLKKPEYSLRIKNDSSETLVNYQVGKIAFGTIPSGQTTNYYPIDPGPQNMSGQLYPSGLMMSGSLSISGAKTGLHKFTIIQTGAGPTIKEDL